MTRPFFYMTGVAVIAVAALSGCAQAELEEHTDAVHAEKSTDLKHATVKPGAAVSFSHSFEGPLTVGQDGQIMLTISEAYTSGVMTVEVIVDQGLSVFGATSKTIQLSGGPDHIWPITFSAVQNGVQYLRVRAVTDIDGQPSSARSYAVPVDVGGTPNASTQKTNSMTVMPDGEEVIMMEAEETNE